MSFIVCIDVDGLIAHTFTRLKNGHGTTKHEEDAPTYTAPPAPDKAIFREKNTDVIPIKVLVTSR